MAIHPTAIVDKHAEVDPTAEVGPYCIVHAGASLGPDTRLLSHVVIHSHTHLGARNTVHPFASVGGAPQDLKFGGEPSRLIIGDDNTIRESVTLNRGTEEGGMETRIGDGCLLMAYSHVAHDCILGNQVILANSVSLAGHVVLNDHVIAGGIAGIHQFCRVGRHAFLAGGAMVTQDILPFTIAQGDRAEHAGVNVVGLRRAGWSRDQIQAVRSGYRSLFSSEGTRAERLLETESSLAKESPLIAELCDFVRSASRGVSGARGLANGGASVS